MLSTNILTTELFGYANFAIHFCRQEGKFRLNLTLQGLEAPTLQVPAARKTQQEKCYWMLTLISAPATSCSLLPRLTHTPLGTTCHCHPYLLQFSCRDLKGPKR